MQHPADVGALAVRLAGVVGIKRLRLVRETVELDVDVLLLAQPVQGRPRLAQRLEHGLPARPVGFILDRHALGAVEDDVETEPPASPSLGKREGRPQDRHGGEQEGGAAQGKDGGDAARRPAGAEVRRRREAGQAHRHDVQHRQADAGQPPQPDAAGSRHFQRRFPGVADGRPGQQADDDEAAAEHEPAPLPRRRIGGQAGSAKRTPRRRP